MKISILIICLLFSSILSLEEIDVIELNQELKFTIDSKTKYIASKNTINGIYIYDVLSPNNLNITFAKYDSLESPINENDFDGHNETVQNYKNFLVSAVVSVGDDDKYTFLKIDNLDYDYDSEPIEIKVKLTGEYTWKILVITFGMFTIVLLILFLFIHFGKNFLTNYCNYR